ncbi:MAG TPA: 2Fe-2S iron-sulfur cluster-binding protein [Alphaproteobacteria bacterium]
MTKKTNVAVADARSISRTATLVIRRGNPGEAATWDSFEVAFEPGQSVLDGLRRIRIERDPTLAFRFSCINANACKECMMLVDGKVVYACTARLEPREMRLEPLPNKALVRDLATEIAPPDERLDNLVGGSLVTKG